MTLYIRIKSCSEVVDKKGKTNSFVMQFQEYGTTNSATSSRFHGDKPKFKDEILEMPIKKYDKHRLLCDITTNSQDKPVILAQLVFDIALLPRNKQTKITFVYPKTKYGVRIQATLEFHYCTNDDEPFDAPFKDIKVEDFQRSMIEGANASNNDNKRYTVRAAGYTDEDERARAVSEKIQRAREQFLEEEEDNGQSTISTKSKNFDSNPQQKTFVADMAVAPMTAPPQTDVHTFESQGFNSAQFKSQTQMPVSSPPPATSQLPPIDAWIDQRLTPVPKPPADRIQYFTQFQQTVKDYQTQYGPQYAKQYYDQYISYFQDCTSFLTYAEERKKLIAQYQQLQQQQAMQSHSQQQFNTLQPQNPQMQYPTPQQQQSMQQIQMLQQQINMLISQQQQNHQQQQSMQQIQQLQQQVQFLQQQLQQQQNQQQNQQQQPQSPPQQFNTSPIQLKNAQKPQQNMQFQTQYQYNQHQPMQNVPQNQYQSQYQQQPQTMMPQPQNQFQTQYTMRQQPQFQTQFNYGYNQNYDQQRMMANNGSNPQINYITPPQQKLPNEGQQFNTMPVMSQPQQPMQQQMQMMPPQQMQNDQQQMQSLPMMQQQVQQQVQQPQQQQPQMPQMQMMPQTQQIQPDQQQLQQLPGMPQPNQPTPPQPQLTPLPGLQMPQQQNQIDQNSELPQLPALPPQQALSQQAAPQSGLPPPPQQMFSQMNVTSTYNKPNLPPPNSQTNGLPPPPNFSGFNRPY